MTDSQYHSEARICAEAERRVSPTTLSVLLGDTVDTGYTFDVLWECDQACSGRIPGVALFTIRGHHFLKTSDACPMLERFAHLDDQIDEGTNYL